MSVVSEHEAFQALLDAAKACKWMVDRCEGMDDVSDAQVDAFRDAVKGAERELP